MRNLKLFIGVLFLGGILIFLTSADHIDAPDVSSTSADLGDFYAFQSPGNTDNMVFVTTLQGLMSPGMTSSASFDENVLTEINIDNNGDYVEDLVIQLIPKDGKMYAFGPYQPSLTGKQSMINENAPKMDVDITSYGNNAIMSSQGNMRLFAGPRDDPFFFDIAQFNEILAGNATGFNNPGTDTFAGTNVLSIVVEVPKSSLGATDMINTWVVTKSKS